MMIGTKPRAPHTAHLAVTDGEVNLRASFDLMQAVANWAIDWPEGHARLVNPVIRVDVRRVSRDSLKRIEVELRGMREVQRGNGMRQPVDIELAHYDGETAVFDCQLC